MDVKQEGYKIPKIQYEVYYPLYKDSKLYLLNLRTVKPCLIFKLDPF